MHANSGQKQLPSLQNYRKGSVSSAPVLLFKRGTGPKKQKRKNKYDVLKLFGTQPFAVFDCS